MFLIEIATVGPSPSCRVAMITASPGTVMYRAVHSRPFSAILKNGVYMLRTINVLGPLPPDKQSAISDKVCFNNAYARAWSREEARDYLWGALRSMRAQLPSKDLVAYEIEVNETSQDFGPTNFKRMSRAVIRVDLGNTSSILRGPWRDSRTTSTNAIYGCLCSAICCLRLHCGGSDHCWCTPVYVVSGSAANQPAGESGSAPPVSTRTVHQFWALKCVTFHSPSTLLAYGHDLLVCRSDCQLDFLPRANATWLKQ